MAILDSAEWLFRTEGWSAVTIAAIAKKAEVSSETVYSRFGNKKTIVSQLVARAMRGDEPGVPAMRQERRDIVLNAQNGDDLIAAFADDIGDLLSRVAPLMGVVRSAAETDVEMAALYVEFHQSRRNNLGKMIATLENIGALRSSLVRDEALDTLWSVASPELWLLRLGQTGATADSNRDWLRTTLRRLLLD